MRRRAREPEADEQEESHVAGELRAFGGPAGISDGTRAVLDRLLALPATSSRAVLDQLEDEERQAVCLALKYDWRRWARPEQLPPTGAWDVWIMLAGRAGGKTRPGSEITIEWSRDNPLIALMAKDAAMVRDVLIEGDSGILACSPPWWRPKYDKTKLRLTWPNGAQALQLSAEAGADAARGRQFYKARAEEVATWPHVEEGWNEGLANAVRLGPQPQIVVTGTPTRTPFIADLCLGKKDKETGNRPVSTDEMAYNGRPWVSWHHDSVGKNGLVHRTVVHRWKTERNADNLSPGFADKRRQQYGASALAAQELDAEILEKVVGALFTQELLDQHRRQGLTTTLQTVAVAVDPTRSDTPVDEAGIVVGGAGEDGDGYLLADCSLRGTPDEWCNAAIDAYRRYRADVLVVEKNRMGAMIRDLVRTRDPKVRLVEVHASDGKRSRAEPVSALCEQGRIHHVGLFPVLEDELVTWDPMMRISPNRMDAYVWLWTYLLLGRHTVPLRLV